MAVFYGPKAGDGTRPLKWQPIVAAVLIFGLLLGGGIATEATGLSQSSAALFGFAGAIFGVVVGFLGKESGEE
jgi:hypothetical protein